MANAYSAGGSTKGAESEASSLGVVRGAKWSDFRGTLAGTFSGGEWFAEFSEQAGFPVGKQGLVSFATPERSSSCQIA